MEETVGQAAMAAEVGTVDQAALVSAASASRAQLEMAALVVIRDPEALAELVVKVAMVGKVVGQQILPSSLHPGITTCLASEPSATQAVVVAQEIQVEGDEVERREHPAAAEPGATSAVAMDVTEKTVPMVIKVSQDGGACRETGGTGEIQVHSLFSFFEKSGRTLQVGSQLWTRSFAH